MFDLIIIKCWGVTYLAKAALGQGEALLELHEKALDAGAHTCQDLQDQWPGPGDCYVDEDCTQQDVDNIRYWCAKEGEDVYEGFI